jgi:glutamate racemase
LAKEGPVNLNPIGVFDSGLGGLSVVHHLRRELPAENLLYFGDTARVPYGSKSRRTVVSFALEAARFLLQYEPKLIVAACNTASALALDELQRELPVPVIGVVEPGARAAVERAAGQPIAVLGTEATIGSGSYVAAIQALHPGHVVVQRACPLFVPLVEEGRECADPIVRAVVEAYLAPLRGQGVRVVILGCTHYPLLRPAIAECLGADIEIVESGRETARAVVAHLRGVGGLCPPGRRGSMAYYVSDNAPRFRRVGSRFLEEEIESVEFVEPERYIAAGTRHPQPG